MLGTNDCKTVFRASPEQIGSGLEQCIIRFEAFVPPERILVVSPILLGRDVWLPETANDHVLGIGRYYRGEKLIALFNFSDEPQIAWIREQEPYISMTDGKRYDTGAVKLPAGGFVWLLHKFGGDDAA